MINVNLSALVEFFLERLGCVVGAKQLGAQVLHVLFEVVVETAAVNFTEDIFAGLLVFAKGHQVFIDNWIYIDGIAVTHGVLSYKI